MGERARMELVFGQSNHDERQKLITGLYQVGAFKGKHGAKWTTLFSTPWRSLEKDGEYNPDENARVIFSDISLFLDKESQQIEKALQKAFETDDGALKSVSESRLVDE
jgi:hypothetical protein